MTTKTCPQEFLLLLLLPFRLLRQEVAAPCAERAEDE
jgi:hypothetical protein